MRVALDAGPLLDPSTGVGRYTQELGDALERRGVEVVRYAVAWGGRRNDSIVRWRVPARAAQASWRRWGHPRVERLTGAVEVVHATNFVLPSLGPTPGVVTVHDLSFLRDDAFPGAARLRELVPWSIARAARTLVPSEAMAEEVAEAYKLSSDRISVTREGVATVFFGATPLGEEALARLGVRPPFALAVGTVEPRKNLPSLLEAWGQAGLEGWTLVVAGPAGWGPELRAPTGVIHLGWVGDETLPGLLAAAELFCYVSSYEGFGLPPLEAMAAGTAAIVGRYSAAPETVGEAAALVDPTNPESIADALQRLAGDPAGRARLARKGRARASMFTWEATAAATLDVYEAVADV